MNSAFFCAVACLSTDSDKAGVIKPLVPPTHTKLTSRKTQSHGAT